MAAGGTIGNVATLPAGFTAGPMVVATDANLWFAEAGRAGGPALGKVSASGVRAEVPLPATDAGYAITAVAADPAGGVWYALADSGTQTGGGSGKVGKVNPDGSVTEYPLTMQPGAVTVGADGHPYVSIGQGGLSEIARVNGDGSLSLFPVAGAAQPVSWLTKGPDGNLWFVDGPKIGKMTPAGVVTEYPVAAPQGSTTPVDLTDAQLSASADGNLWFLGAGGISKITTAGTVTTIGAAGSQVTALAAGPDGNVWVALVPPAGSRLALVPGEAVVRLTPDGQITPLPDHVTGGTVERMAGGSGALWLDAGGAALSRINVGAVATITPAMITPTTPHPVTTDARKTLAGPIVSFTANYPGALASDFTATIGYGDGFKGTGAVVSDSNGGFNVLGYNTYTLPAGTKVKVKVDVSAHGVVTEIYGVVVIASPPAAPAGKGHAAHAIPHTPARPVHPKAPVKHPSAVAHPKAPVGHKVVVKKK